MSNTWRRPAARWILPEIDRCAVGVMADSLRIRPVIAEVLASRGIRDCSAASEFLSPSLSALHDPLSMLDMDRAAARLWNAIQAREPILLYGDYDVDGTSSIVVLKKAIEILGGSSSYHIPHRLKDGYGMRREVIEEASTKGVRLIVSVDTGIRATEVVRRANELGIDVIVTDHHLPDTEIPPALAVLNPNRPGCSYPNKHLCGAGVTFKFVQALLARSGMPEVRRAALLDSFLKPVAIATVADVVPLTGENRVIVRRGLSGLSSVRNAGLRALLSVSGFEEGDIPSAHQVGFRLAPRINAAGRMDTARNVIELFLTADCDRARELAEQLDVLNRERQQTEAQIVEAILKQCEAGESSLDSHAMVFAGDGWHLGVLGIVASRLVERFSRPVFVLSNSEEEHLSGSGRSIPAFHLLEALESMPHLFKKFGGHRQAAGLTLECANLEAFRESFAHFASLNLTLDDLRPTYTVDAMGSFEDLSDASVTDIFSLGPFGFGNPNPVFMASGVEVASAPRSITERKHFTIPLRHGKRTLFCKAWSFEDRIELFQPGAKLDVLFTVDDDQLSRKRGYGGWCATLKDARVSS